MLKNSLRNFSSIVTVVLVLLLSGCSFTIKTNTNDTRIVDKTTEDTSLVSTTEVSTTTEYVQTELIEKSKDLIVMDIAPEYILNTESLAAYRYKNDPNVSYVNISEFIAFMEGGIVDLDISKTDVMTISYVFDVPTEYQETYGPTYTYEMTLDAENEVISLNDFDMITNINGPMLTEYETELVVSDYDVVAGDPSQEIDLSLYNMDIVFFEDGYYIPLYLANLFFTGATINVYEMNDSIYVIDNFSDFNDLTEDFKKDNTKDATDINSHMKNFLGLYFDYFYGLKDYKNIDSYMDVLDDFHFENKSNYYGLNSELERFIYTQDDLHTSLVSAGYMNESYIPSTAQSPKLSRYVNDYYQNECQYRRHEIDYMSYGDTLVIQVNGFSLQTRTLLTRAMEEAQNYNDIIIDVGCNPGGNLIGVVELLSYMTDEQIPVSYINPMTGEKITEYYETTNNVFLDKNFYVYTTAASFSAANLFTSIVKDQELGIVFGEKSGGGACAITYIVLPNGAIIVNSSNFTLVNKDDEIIEDGIDVDVEYLFPFDWSTVVADLNTHQE